MAGADAGAALIPVPGTIDFGSARQVVDQLDQALRAEPGRGLDLAPLDRFDSSALSVLLELRRRHGGPAGGLTLANPTDALRSLAQVYGLESLLFAAG